MGSLVALPALARPDVIATDIAVRAFMATEGIPAAHVTLIRGEDHRSSKYNDAPMPSKFAEELFAASPMGMMVVVVDEHSAPARWFTRLPFVDRKGPRGEETPDFAFAELDSGHGRLSYRAPMTVSCRMRLRWTAAAPYRSRGSRHCSH